MMIIFQILEIIFLEFMHQHNEGNKLAINVLAHCKFIIFITYDANRS